MSANHRCTSVVGENGAAATPIHLILPPPPLLTGFSHAWMVSLSPSLDEMGQGRWFEEGFPLPYPILVPILTSLRIGEDGERRSSSFFPDDLSLFLLYLIQPLFGGGKLTVARVFASPIRGGICCAFPSSLAAKFYKAFYCPLPPLLPWREKPQVTNKLCVRLRRQGWAGLLRWWLLIHAHSPRFPFPS